MDWKPSTSVMVFHLATAAALAAAIIYLDYRVKNADSVDVKSMILGAGIVAGASFLAASLIKPKIIGG